jgi:hypothetical protein
VQDSFKRLVWCTRIACLVEEVVDCAEFQA